MMTSKRLSVSAVSAVYLLWKNKSSSISCRHQRRSAYLQVDGQNTRIFGLAGSCPSLRVGAFVAVLLRYAHAYSAERKVAVQYWANNFPGKYSVPSRPRFPLFLFSCSLCGNQREKKSNQAENISTQTARLLRPDGLMVGLGSLNASREVRRKP